MHTCNPSTQEVEAGSWPWGETGLQRKALSQNKENNLLHREIGFKKMVRKVPQCLTPVYEKERLTTTQTRRRAPPDCLGKTKHCRLDRAFLVRGEGAPWQPLVPVPHPTHSPPSARGALGPASPQTSHHPRTEGHHAWSYWSSEPGWLLDGPAT